MHIPPEELIGALRQLNPWWVAKQVPDNLAPSIRRLAFHESLHLLSTPTRRAIFLSGARRVGKTTVLYQLAGDFLKRGTAPVNILYLSFDHPFLKLAGIRRLLDLYEQEVGPRPGGQLLLLDEVQYADDWELWVKQLVDREPVWRIAAAGSATVLLSESLVESGTGRWVTVQVPPLSFYEFLALRKVPEPLDLPEATFPLDIA
ncbi:MAG: AAA family ATPase [Thermaerobacter sp.]|jgi:hypothetical protein|nr:AAA family ATPase [Thermaerobacter sp.]